MAVRKIITEDGGYIKFENDEEYYAYLQEQAELRRRREEAEMARAIKKTIVAAIVIIPFIFIGLCSPKTEKNQEKASQPVKTQKKIEKIENQPVQTIPVVNQSELGENNAEIKNSMMLQPVESPEKRVEEIEIEETTGLDETELEKEVRLDFSKQKVYDIVDVMPVYPDGEHELMDYIANKVEYPQEAVERGVEGRVFVKFIVEPDGSISNAKIIRGIGYGCDEEAIRVIESLPNWEPGRRRNEVVRVAMTVPVNFKLQ